MGVVVRRYIDIRTPLACISSFLAAASFMFKKFSVIVYVIFVQYSKRCSTNIRDG